MAQELEDLIIKVDSELGDLQGIDSAVNALKGLREFAQDAQKGAGSLKTMADAMSTIDKFGKTKTGIKKAKESIDDLIEVLNKLSNYTGKAREGIAQLSLLGKALKNFAGLGDNLKGLENVSNSINGIIDAMVKLSGISGSVNKATNSVKDIKKAFNFSSSVKKSNKDLKESEKNLEHWSKVRKDALQTLREKKASRQATSKDQEIPLSNIQKMEKQLDEYRKRKQKVDNDMRNAQQKIDFAKSQGAKVGKSLDYSKEVKQGAEETSKALASAVKKIKAQNDNLIKGNQIKLSNEFFKGFDLGALNKAEQEAILGIKGAYKNVFASAEMSNKDMMARLKKQRILDFGQTLRQQANEDAKGSLKIDKASDLVPFDWFESMGKRIRGSKFNEQNPIQTFALEAQKSLEQLEPISKQLAEKISQIEQAISSAYDHNQNARKQGSAIPVDDFIKQINSELKESKGKVEQAVADNKVEITMDNLLHIDKSKMDMAQLSTLETWIKKRIAQLQQDIKDSTAKGSSDAGYIDSLKGFLTDFQGELVRVQSQIGKLKMPTADASKVGDGLSSALSKQESAVDVSNKHLQELNQRRKEILSDLVGVAGDKFDQGLFYTESPIADERDFADLERFNDRYQELAKQYLAINDEIAKSGGKAVNINGLKDGWWVSDLDFQNALKEVSKIADASKVGASEFKASSDNIGAATTSANKLVDATNNIATSASKASEGYSKLAEIIQGLSSISGGLPLSSPIGQELNQRIAQYKGAVIDLEGLQKHINSFIGQYSSELDSSGNIDAQREVQALEKVIHYMNELNRLKSESSSEPIVDSSEINPTTEATDRLAKAMQDVADASKIAENAIMASQRASNEVNEEHLQENAIHKILELAHAYEVLAEEKMKAVGLHPTTDALNDSYLSQIPKNLHEIVGRIYAEYSKLEEGVDNSFLDSANAKLGDVIGGMGKLLNKSSIPNLDKIKSSYVELEKHIAQYQQDMVLDLENQKIDLPFPDVNMATYKKSALEKIEKYISSDDITANIRAFYATAEEDWSKVANRFPVEKLSEMGKLLANRINENNGDMIRLENIFPRVDWDTAVKINEEYKGLKEQALDMENMLEQVQKAISSKASELKPRDDSDVQSTIDREAERAKALNQLIQIEEEIQEKLGTFVNLVNSEYDLKLTKNKKGSNFERGEDLKDTQEQIKALSSEMDKAVSDRTKAEDGVHNAFGMISFSEITDGMEKSAGSTAEFAKFMETLAKNADDASKALSNVSSFADVVKGLSSYMASDVEWRPEQGLFGDSVRGFSSKVIHGSRDSIAGEQIYALQKELDAVGEIVDTFFHSHPSNIASFSPSDWFSGVQEYVEGIRHQVVVGLKEFSTIDYGKINPSDYMGIYESFCENLYKMGDELFTVTRGEIEKALGGSAFSDILFGRIEKAFNAETLNNNFSKIKAIFDGYMSQIKDGQFINANDIGDALANQFIQGLNLDSSQTERFSAVIRSYIRDVFSSVYDDKFGSAITDDKFQSVVKDSLKNALTMHGYDANEIYKSFPIDTFTDMLYAVSGNVDKDNVLLQHAIDERAQIIARLAEINQSYASTWEQGELDYEREGLQERLSELEGQIEEWAKFSSSSIGGELDGSINQVTEDADKMKYVLVVGSRTFRDYEQLAEVLDRVAQGYEKITIVSGGAQGADALAKRYAKEKGYGYKEFPAEWDKYGKSAGYKRNEQMHEYIAQFDDRKVVAFWDGVSKGTQHSFDLAKKYNNELEVIKFNASEQFKGNATSKDSFIVRQAKEFASDTEKYKDLIGDKIKQIEGFLETKQKELAQYEDALASGNAGKWTENYKDKITQIKGQIGESQQALKILRDATNVKEEKTSTQGSKSFVIQQAEELTKDVEKFGSIIKDKVSQLEHNLEFFKERVASYKEGLSDKSAGQWADTYKEQLDKYTRYQEETEKALSIYRDALAKQFSTSPVSGESGLTQSVEADNKTLESLINERIDILNQLVKVTEHVNFNADMIKSIKGRITTISGGESQSIYEEALPKWVKRQQELVAQLKGVDANLGQYVNVAELEKENSAMIEANKQLQEMYQWQKKIFGGRQKSNAFDVKTQTYAKFHNSDVREQTYARTPKASIPKVEEEPSAISDMIKLLNDFVDTISKLDGISKKLEGLDDAVGGINKLVDVLKILSEYTGDASGSIEQFKALGEALQAFANLGTSLEGIEKVHKGVILMIDTLKMLSEYKGKAGSAITQFGNLGKALQEFAELGKSLEGLNAIYNGVDKMVNVLVKVSNIEKISQGNINRLGDLGKALHEFNGLDSNLVGLNEISVGLMNLSKATEAMKGSKKSDFEYINKIATALGSFDGVLTGRQYTNVSNITSALAQLVTALKETKQIDVGSIEAIGTAIKNAFNNDEFVSSATKITHVLEALYKAYGAIAIQSNSVRDTMNLMVSSFKNASDALYDVRSNIEIISTDFTDALQPVTNSALFDTLKEFKKLNDSYKNVAGLGQGLGTLLSALNQLKGKTVDISPLRTLLEDLEKLANDKNIDVLGAKFDKLTNMAQPVGILLNSLKYTDLQGSNKTLTTLANQLRKFYEDLPKGFDKISFTLNAIHKLIDLAKKDEGFDPENNAIANLGVTLKEFNGLSLPKLADFAQGVGQILSVLRSIPKDTFINTQPLTQLLDTLQYTDSSMQNAQVILSTVKSIEGVNKLDTTKFKALNEELNNLIMILGGAPSIDKNAFKGVADVIKTLTQADMKNVEADKLEVIVEALAKLADHLANIKGSNNKINITLDSDGVANFSRVIQKTDEEYSRFARNLNEAIDDVDYSHLFDLTAPVSSLRKQLREAERMLHSTMKKIEEEKAKVNRSNVVNDKPELTERQMVLYEQLRAKADSLRDTIRNLHIAIESAPRFETYAEGAQYLANLKQEYKRYEEVMKRFKGFDAPSGSNMGQMFEVIRLRMDEITKEIEDSDEALKNMELSIEDVADSARIAADEMTRMADEAERASQEMRDSVGNGFGQFGSMLSGSKNPVLGALGNISNMFGKAVKDGTAVMGDSQLASLSSLAGTLGTVATAVAQVSAVVGVVVAVIQTWWKTMSKVRDTLIQFVQSLTQFAKTMLDKVVGAFNAVAGAVSKVASAVKSGAEIVVSALHKIGEVSGKIISIFGKLGGAVAPAVKGIKSIMMAVSPKFVKTLVNSNFQLSKIIKQTHILKGAVKTLTRYFSMMTRMLMRKSITAFFNKMKQAFEDMVLFEKNADDAMLQLEYNVSIVFSALRRLANQVVAIFEPLINAISAPAETFLTSLQGMAENMAKFMAILTGQPYYLRAKKFYESYGDSLDETAKKAKNLTNGLDELNILNDKRDNKGVTPDMEFEEVLIDEGFGLNIPALKDIIDKIVDFLKNIDWQKIWKTIEDFIDKVMGYINYILSRLDLAEWLGKTLGDLINTIFVILERLADNFDPHALAAWLSEFIVNAIDQIDWDRIYRTVTKWAHKLAEFWNDIFADEKLWDRIVTLIVNTLDAIMRFFEEWAWTFDFSGMAQQLTDSIAEVLQKFDWERLRHTVEGWVTGLVDFINTAMANKEFWITLGDSIAKFVNIVLEAFNKLGDIDFANAVDSLKLAIERFLEGIRWDEFYEAISKWAQNIADVVNGLFTDEKFLTEIFVSISNFVNGIIDLFDKAIKKLKAYDIGKTIADSLITGLQNVNWDTLFKLPADALNALSNAVKGILDAIPADFSLADWIFNHLAITYDSIDWKTLEDNLYRIGDKIFKFINDTIHNDNFWRMFGDLTIRGLRFVAEFTEDVLNIDWDDLATRISNYLNGIVQSGQIQRIITNVGKATIKLAFTIFAVIEGIDWEELGKQIGAGIADVIDELYANRNKIKQDIENAFESFSTFISNIFKEMFTSNSFYKLGTTMAGILVGIINGIAIFFDDNGTNIIKAIRDFANGLADYLKAHEDEIVNSLTVIINSISDILNAFFDEKGKLHKELTRIVERLEQPIGKLLGTIVSILIRKFTEKFEDITALTDALFSWEGMEGFIEGIADALIDFLKTFLGKLWEKIKAKLNPISLLQECGILPKGGIGGFLIGLLQGAFTGDFSLADLFKGISFHDEDKAGESLLSKAKEKIEKGVKGVKDFFGNIGDFLFGKDKAKAEIPVEITPVVDKDKKYKLEDIQGNAELQFEDAKLGKIKADAIEVKVFKGDNLDAEEMFADTLTVIDIVADKLTVKEIVTDNDTVSKDMEKAYGGNTIEAKGDNLSNNLDVDTITARLLEVSEKITAPLVEIAEKITTPLIEVIESITTPLIDAKKIKTKLLDAKKITTKLLEAEKITTELLEVTDKVTAEKFEITKKATAKLFEVDKIVAKENGLGDLTAEVQEFEKIVSQLIETPELRAEKVMVDALNASQITANAFNVSNINAQLLTVSNIVANALKVGTIYGNLSGGTGGTQTININTDGGIDWSGYGGTGYIAKPQFEAGDRWSDISGLVPSAEDFLDGISEYYNKATGGWGTGSAPRTGYETYSGGSLSYLGGNTSTANGGNISELGKLASKYGGYSKNPVKDFVEGDVEYWRGYYDKHEDQREKVKQKYSNLSSDAEYIRDYLVGAIGNENGAFGLLANLYKESKLLSNNLQGTASDGGVNQKDIDYTNAVNSGQKNFVDNRGYGLAQWTVDDRKKAFYDSLNGRSVDDLDAQLEYLVKELQTDYADVWKTLQNATSVEEASNAVVTKFEKPSEILKGGMSAEVEKNNRLKIAQDLVALLGDGISPIYDDVEPIDIPDEPTPTGEIPKQDNNGLYDGFDEANVIGDETTGGGGISFPFLDSLPLQTEYKMAEVYNIIDKWLGRIYRLFESFNIEDFLGDMFDLDDMTFKLVGVESLITAIKNLTKAINKLISTIENLIKVINELIAELKLLTDAVKKCTDAINKCIVALNNLKDAVKQCTKAIEKLTEAIGNNTPAITNLKGAIERCIATINTLIGRINALIDAINNAITAIHGNTDALNNLADIIRTAFDSSSLYETIKRAIEDANLRVTAVIENIEAVAHAEANILGDIIKNFNTNTSDAHLVNNTNAKSANTKAVEANTRAINDLYKGLNGFTTGLRDSVSNITCNCNCNCNCGGCAMGGNEGGGKGGRNIKDIKNEPTPTSDVGNGGYEPPTSGSSDGGDPVPESPNYTEGFHQTPYNPQTIDNSDNTGYSSTGDSGWWHTIGNSSGGSNIVWQNANGSKASLFALVDGKKVRLDENALSDEMKALIASGKYLITDSKGNPLSAADRKKLLAFLKKRWAKYLAKKYNGKSYKNALDSYGDLSESDAKKLVQKEMEKYNAPNTSTADGGHLVDNGGGKDHPQNNGSGNNGGGEDHPQNNDSGDNGGGEDHPQDDSGNQPQDNGGEEPKNNQPNKGDTWLDSEGNWHYSSDALMNDRIFTGRLNGAYGAKTYVDESLIDDNKDMAVKWVDTTLGKLDSSVDESKKGYAISTSLGAYKYGVLDKWKALRDEENRKVENYRNEAQQYYDNIMAKGDDSTKAQAKSRYDYLMKNQNASSSETYKNQLDALKLYSLMADGYNDPKALENLAQSYYNDIVNSPYATWQQKDNAKTLLSNIKMRTSGNMGSPKDAAGFLMNLKNLKDAVTGQNGKTQTQKNLRLGANGGIFNVNDLAKTDSGKKILANALISDRDSQGNEISWFLQSNGTGNSADSKDKITDTKVINEMKDYIRSLGITEDMANFGSANQKAYDVYKAIQKDSSISSDDKAKAKQYFNSYLAWNSSSNADSRATKQKYYLDNLQKIAGLETDSEKEQKVANQARQKELDEAVKKITEDDAYVLFGKSSYTYGSSKEYPVNQNFDKTASLKEIAEGKTKLDKFSVDAGKFVAENATEAKTLFDAWYQRFLAKGYQMGGMPNSGEIFVARENGTPEFVGSFGGRTAVANNDQIVTAVANGVSMANDRMVSAIESQTSRLENAIDRKDVDVVIGDRQIAEANRRGQQGMGRKFVD